MKRLIKENVANVNVGNVLICGRFLNLQTEIYMTLLNLKYWQRNLFDKISVSTGEKVTNKT